MMHPSARHPALMGLALVDALIAAASLYTAYVIRASVLPKWSSVWSGSVPLQPTFAAILLGSLPIIVCALYVSGAYSWHRFRGVFQVFVSVVRAFLLTTPMVLAYGYALRDMGFSRAIVVSYLIICFALICCSRLTVRQMFHVLHARGFGLEKAVIVGTSPAAEAIAHSMSRKPYLGYQVCGLVSLPFEKGGNPSLRTLGGVGDLPRIVDENVVDTVVFAVSLEEAACYEHIILKLEEVGKTVHLRGDAIGGMLSRTFVGEFEGIPMLTLKSTPSDLLALALKRVLDIVGSAVGLVLISPLVLATAIAVKLSSAGPVFYSQERVCRNGRRFKIRKFRSMYLDADARLSALRSENEMSGPVFKMTNDPRVTPIGKWIRRYSIDELPQLWNVLTGEMSLVGPRPPIPAEVESYERWQRRRLSMRPGITCLWQVNGRNDIDFDSWMKLDMEYIDCWSLGLDLKILLKTIPVVLTARGAR